MAVPNCLPAGTSKDGGISLRLSCHVIAVPDRFRLTTPMILNPIGTNFTYVFLSSKYVFPIIVMSAVPCPP